MTQRANNNLSVLPFYTDIELQNHRKSYAYGKVYPLYCPVNRILPFQITRTETGAILWIRMYKLTGEYVADLLTEMQQTGLSVVTRTGDDYNTIVYSGIMPLATNMLQGQYYIAIHTANATYYSDVFTVVAQISPFLMIEWYDDDDLVMEGCRVVYGSPRFINRLWLAVELGKPDYTFTEEGEERDGFYFPEKQLSEKKYKFTMLAPEYLCDVTRFIRMSDHVRITDKYGREYFPDQFLMTPKWQDQGDIASVEVEFQTATVAKKIGRGVLNTGGDFNNDFNDDFLNS